MTSSDIEDERARRRQRITGLAAFAAIFGISIASIFGGELLQSSEAERNRAPKLELIVVGSGEPVRVDPKNPTVLHFVASSCETCAEDLTALDRSRRRWEGKVNYVVVVEAPAETVREVFGGVDESIQVASDPDLASAKAYRIDDLPATVFVTADGQILERDVGPLVNDELERRIRSVIAEGPG